MSKASLTSLLLLGMATLVAGCHSCESMCQESIARLRDHCEAKEAWHAARDCYVDCEPQLHHFGMGYIDGYEAVARGGDGCPPMLPPQKMWGPCYQTCEGREQIVAWYNGYSHGAFAAQSDGVQQLNQIVTSRDLYGNKCRREPVQIDLSQFEQGQAQPEFLPQGNLQLPVQPAPMEPQSPGEYAPGLLPPAPAAQPAL